MKVLLTDPYNPGKVLTVYWKEPEVSMTYSVPTALPGVGTNVSAYLSDDYCALRGVTTVGREKRPEGLPAQVSEEWFKVPPLRPTKLTIEVASKQYDLLESGVLLQTIRVGPAGELDLAANATFFSQLGITSKMVPYVEPDSSQAGGLGAGKGTFAEHAAAIIEALLVAKKA
ncbi:MAG: hypothetical protein U1E65_36225 [Myxococcota bacterium]